MDPTLPLQPYSTADALEVLAAVRESHAEVSPWMVWSRADYSLDDAAAWIRQTIDGHSTGSMFEFAIVDGDGRYAGAAASITSTM